VRLAGARVTWGRADRGCGVATAENLVAWFAGMVGSAVLSSPRAADGVDEPRRVHCSGLQWVIAAVEMMPRSHDPSAA
jgi:hypothetical protein